MPVTTSESFICKLCEQPGKAINAHIIPRAFFEDNKVGEPHLLILGPKRVTRSNIGVYDENIVCDDCERQIFSPLDDYGRKLIKRIQAKPPAILTGNKGNINFKQIDDHMYQKTKLFFVSILWRASVSTRPEYRHVKLGPLEQEAKRLVTPDSFDKDNLFQVALSYFKPSLKVQKGELIVMMPIKGKIESRHSYRMHFGGLNIHICAEKRGWPTNGSLDQIRLKEKRPLIISERDLDSSKAMESFIKLAKSYKSPKL